ncbi:acetyl-CoA carboxylase carboxyl transferase subunit beta, chloroplastic [Plakobranchus ocellatus]|uniref:Acetyl-CoA carboxylase carboxyl transferase subunit beta, chloroplastic n=1 Tax=Plakobranchus ocellatus TaxID=259542 RepID=A0AAV3YMX6_9GAST|nr:acetyl-CoA carboxylase carboxyl transferase subunit beta, chloroplastic [Plakobranchus ocellatus]
MDKNKRVCGSGVSPQPMSASFDGELSETGFIQKKNKGSHLSTESDESWREKNAGEEEVEDGIEDDVDGEEIKENKMESTKALISSQEKEENNKGDSERPSEGENLYECALEIFDTSRDPNRSDLPAKPSLTCSSSLKQAEIENSFDSGSAFKTPLEQSCPIIDTCTATIQGPPSATALLETMTKSSGCDNQMIKATEENSEQTYREIEQMLHEQTSDDDDDDNEEDKEVDNQLENIPKSVTFAEDKEVFDMGFVLPASVTVHLDTPVSSIAPGDVQISVESVQPVCDSASAYPISGILKTEEGCENKEDGMPDLVSADVHSEDSIGAWYGDSEQSVVRESCLGAKEWADTPKPSDLRHDMAGDFNAMRTCPSKGTNEVRDIIQEAAASNLIDADDCEQAAIGEIVEDVQTTSVDGDYGVAKDNGVATAQAKTYGEPENAELDSEEDDAATHRGFIVETVPEHELLKPEDNVAAHVAECNGVRKPHSSPVNGMKPFAPSSDGFSHSTDSTYQDTIGPLDNPQFLKTLNYTASQAFDQDEHFGLHSAGLDARSLADIQDPPDLDAGWAWIVLVASFVGATLLGASVYAADYPACLKLSSLPRLSKVSVYPSYPNCPVYPSYPNCPVYLDHPDCSNYTDCPNYTDHPDYPDLPGHLCYPKYPECPNYPN